MKIDISICAEEPQFLEVRVDSNYFKKLPKSLFIRKISSLQRCSSLEELLELIEKVMAEGAFRYVLSLLAKKGYFSRELREKLSKRGYSLKAIEKTIELCTARGYLNDEAESERAIASEVRKGRGPLYIAAKLKARSRIVSPAIKNIDQRASILLLLPKLCKKYDPKTYEGRGKLFQALQRRGFETEAILSCIEQQFPV